MMINSTGEIMNGWPLFRTSRLRYLLYFLTPVAILVAIYYAWWLPKAISPIEKVHRRPVANAVLFYIEK